MTRHEYARELKLLEIKKKELEKEFINSNAKFKVGDIAELPFNNRKIIVQSIHLLDERIIVYEGTIWRKDGKIGKMTDHYLQSIEWV